MALEETLSIRFSGEEIAEIERIAKQHDRSRGYVIRELIGEALNARREKEQDHESP